MADLIKFKFVGGQELDRALMRMDRKAARNTITRAMRRTLNPFKMRLQEKVRSDLTTMNAQARAIYAKQIYISYRAERGGVIAGLIKTRNKFVETPRGRTKFSKLAHLFEGGVKPHKIKQRKRKRTINHPGIPSKPIWSRSFDDLSRDMVGYFRDVMFNEIAKEWNKNK
jgi:hypothetical protein